MKTGTMRHVAILCVVTMSAAGGALAQSTDWNRLMDQGDALEHAGNYKEAAAAYEGALRIAEKFDSTDARLPLTLNKLGITCDELGRFADSDRLYRRAIAWAKHVKGKYSPEYASLVNNLAAVYLQQGQTGKAEPLIREAVEIGTAVFPADDMRLAMARSGLADLLIKHGQYRQSEQLLNQAIQILEKHPEARRDLGIARNNLGVLRRYQKRNEESVRMLEDARVAIEADGGPEHPALTRVFNNLGITYAALGRRDEADRAFRRSLEIAEAHLGMDHPVYGVMLYNYSRFLRDCGRKAEAKTLEAKSRAVIQDSARRNAAGMTVDVSAFRQK